MYLPFSRHLLSYAREHRQTGSVWDQRRSGVRIGVASLLLPFRVPREQFLARNRDVWRRLDPDLDPISLDRQHGDRDGAANDDALANSSSQNQHNTSPFFLTKEGASLFFSSQGCAFCSKQASKRCLLFVGKRADLKQGRLCRARTLPPIARSGQHFLPRKRASVHRATRRHSQSASEPPDRSGCVASAACQ